MIKWILCWTTRLINTDIVAKSSSLAEKDSRNLFWITFIVLCCSRSVAMAPATMDSAEAQWQMQLAAMRAALADLKLPPTSTKGTDFYGSDIDFDDEEFTSGNSGDDVWDFISDSEEDVWSSDPNEDISAPASGLATENYSPEWLHAKCGSFAARKQGLSGDDLEAQIMALLASDSNVEELQSTLTDIIGFDDLDFVIELIYNRQEIVTPSKTDGPLFGKLQTKREREEALRQRDLEHKNAKLGPAMNRDGPEYPHVYTTHVAGNKLDSKGRQYALPVGHTRKEERVSTPLNHLYSNSEQCQCMPCTLYIDIK